MGLGELLCGQLISVGRADGPTRRFMGTLMVKMHQTIRGNIVEPKMYSFIQMLFYKSKLQCI
jgi:hypothetical protein